MPLLLALSVGGSCAPVVTAVKEYRPDCTIFIVSGGKYGSRNTVDGPGKPCGSAPGKEDLPSIQAQTGLLREQFDCVEVSDPDSFHQCYKEIKDELLQQFAARPGWRMVADYTGGTKTMTATLVLVALELGWELSLVKGARTNLVKIEDGTEVAGLVHSWEVRARQQVHLAEDFFNNSAFAASGNLLEGLLRSAALSPTLQSNLRTWIALCRGFDAWDRFNHERARQILHPYRKLITPQWVFLRKLNGELDPSGYEPVIDLLLNAQRRARRGRFDDGVARLYRGIELLAQIRLKQRETPLDAGDLDIGLLPDGLQPEYRQMRDKSGKKRVEVGLVRSYELLVRIGDPLGEVFIRHKDDLLVLLEKRNYSILAHGLKPVDESTYHAMESVASAMVDEALVVLNIQNNGVQFPEMEFRD